mgnify:CR=1 FL=1
MLKLPIEKAYNYTYNICILNKLLGKGIFDTKKILAFVLVAIMAISLTACVNAKPTEKETLVMATNATFPPYEYYDGDEIVGIDAEIAKAIADKLGMELRIDDMEFNSIITAVNSGQADIGMAGMTITEDRKQSVDFSDSYATGVQVVIVTQDSPIQTVDDLAGKKIGVQLTTTGDIYATEEFGKDYVVQFNKGADAVLALKNGQVDAVIIDNQPAKAFVEQNEGLKILETEYANEDYCIAFKKGNDELREKVNNALNELIADGTVQDIIDKYIHE